MPSADCGDYAAIPSLQGSPSADCGVFEVGERSEVGALESSRNLNEVNHFREA